MPSSRPFLKTTAGKTLTLLASIIICELAGVVGALFTVPAIGTWYAALAKPALNPPPFVFGPVWTTLYALIGIAAFLVYQRGRAQNAVPSHAAHNALSIFLLQLVLNAGWSIVFFGLHSPLGGLIIIVALWLAIIVTMVLFYKISQPAMYLLIPYILWVSFATYLNAAIWLLN